MIRAMTDVQDGTATATPGAWSGGERAGAVLLLIIALGLAFVATDIITGGKLTGGRVRDDASG